MKSSCMPPSCSSGSDLPGGTNAMSIQGNSVLARRALYGVVVSLFVASRLRTALRRCHQQSWTFGSHTSRSIPISAMSLSVCAIFGMIPYFSLRQDAQAFNAFDLLPISILSAVDNKQYDKGKPVLSCLAMMPYSS